jgi:hypothetical protein
VTERPRGNAFDRGQATVELALGLPLVAVVLLALVQVAVVARDAVLVTHAAREAARAAAVGADEAEAARVGARSSGLAPGRLAVDVSGPATPGARRTVHLRYRAPTDAPIVGRLLGDVTISTKVTIRAE